MLRLTRRRRRRQTPVQTPVFRMVDTSDSKATKKFIEACFNKEFEKADKLLKRYPPRIFLSDSNINLKSIFIFYNKTYTLSEWAEENVFKNEYVEIAEYILTILKTKKYIMSGSKATKSFINACLNQDFEKADRILKKYPPHPHVFSIYSVDPNSIFAEYKLGNPNSTTTYTLLEWASANGYLPIVEYLCVTFPIIFQWGLDLDSVNKALQLACGNGHVKIVKYLCEIFPPVDDGVDPSANDNVALCMASRNGHFRVVFYLCETFPLGRLNGVDPRAGNNFPLRFACEGGHIKIVRYLCQKFFEHEGGVNVDPRPYDNYALRKACQMGHLNVVMFLCQFYPPGTPGGVDPRDDDNYALRWACRMGHLNVVMFLCEQFSPDEPGGVNPNPRNNEALRRASNNGHLPVVKYLMERFPPGTSYGLPIGKFISVFEDATVRVKEFIIYKILTNEWGIYPYEQRLFEQLLKTEPILTEKVRLVIQLIMERDSHIIEYLY